MEHIPFFHSYDAASQRLTIRGASYFPTEIFRYANAIKILDMSHGQLTTLPAELPRLQHLKIAFFSNNLFTAVPPVLAECRQLELLGFKSCQLNTVPEHSLPTTLRWLILTDNQLTQLPDSLGRLTQLKKLSLAGNRLQTLPDALVACQQLEFFRISANALQSPPVWLQDLPQLAWYGDAGNPFSRQPSSATTVQQINWQELKFGELVGESPSSQVFKATQLATQQMVAVKLYRGALTSDGFPSDDIHNNLAAGAHPNLIQVLGQLAHAPEQKTGLIFTLIPASYHSLGLPPSLATCTRDTYHTNISFTVPYIVKVLKGIAAAGTHLHARGIQHGDLYAHNILVNAVGDALLGDFGAASLYDPTLEPWRETIDVRAFQHLADELVSRCPDTMPESLRAVQSAIRFSDIQKTISII